jgi:hypothetical protein
MIRLMMIVMILLVTPAIYGQSATDIHRAKRATREYWEAKRQEELRERERKIEKCIEELEVAEAAGKPDPSIPPKEEPVKKDTKPKSKKQLLAEKAERDRKAAEAKEQAEIWAESKRRLAERRAEAEKQKKLAEARKGAPKP